MKQKPHVPEPVKEPHAQKPAVKQISKEAEQENLSWHFYVLLAVIAVAVIGLVAKVVGLF